MYKYKMSWTLKDGSRMTNQIYTGEAVSRQLIALEEWGAIDIKVELMTEEETK